jgi:uncharacterized glyoxalase superfamily protein PhnB/uncharacterized protein YndB with AHSA1/START domain
MHINTYLYFDGTCEEAFRFYERVLGAKLGFLMRYGEAPEGPKPPPELAGRVMHASLDVGGRPLMGSDTPPEHYRTPQGFAVSLAVDTPAEAERVFRELGDAGGGATTMAMIETFFAHRFGMLRDRFGIHWMVMAEKRQPTGEPAVPASTADPGKEATETFVVSHTFQAPRDLVWRALSEPERMGRWWGPKGCEVQVLRMEVRPGGVFHYAMRLPVGTEFWGLMQYRAIEAPHRLEFLNSFADAEGRAAPNPMAPVWPLHTHSEFLLDEPAVATTTLTVRWRPHNASPAEQAAFDGAHVSMRNGWAGTFERLAAYLEEAQRGA